MRAEPELVQQLRPCERCGEERIYEGFRSSGQTRWQLIRRCRCQVHPGREPAQLKLGLRK